MNFKEYTVQELIDKLCEYEDKSKPISLCYASVVDKNPDDTRLINIEEIGGDVCLETIDWYCLSNDKKEIDSEK